MRCPRNTIRQITAIWSVTFVLIAAALAEEQAKWVVQPVPHDTVDRGMVPLVYGGIPAAEKFLKTTQNADGSWGENAHSYKATAFALAGFLRRGGNKQTVEKACDWLLTSEPESITDKIAVIVALSNYYRVEGTQHGTPKAMAPDAKAERAAGKVTKLLSAIDEAPNDLWRDLLATTGLPDEKQRPSWAESERKAMFAKYAKRNDEFKMASLDDYLNLLLTSGAKRGSKEYPRLYMNTLLSREKEDGSFPVDDDGDKFAATALVFVMQSRYVHGAPQLGPLPEKPEPAQDKTPVDANTTEEKP